MNTPTEAGPTGAATSKMPLYIYILYLSSILLGITALIGVILAHINRNSGNAMEQSHYVYQIRTFWIGLLFSVIMGALFVTVILAPIAAIMGLALFIWYIVRTIKGLVAFNGGKVIEKPLTWLI